MITGNKFEVWHAITIDNRSLYIKGDQRLSDEMIIEIAGKEYDCVLSKKDIEQMSNNFGGYLQKYKMLL